MVNHAAPRKLSGGAGGGPGGDGAGRSREDRTTCRGVEVVPPSNALCPAPVIAKNFYADPSRVREGNTTTLYWKDILNATACSLSGGGLTFKNLGLSGNKATNAITGTTAFTLTCINGKGGPETSVTTQVTLIPSFQEI